MTDILLLVKPCAEHESDAKAFVAEFQADGAKHIDGGGGIERLKDYSEWLQYNKRMRSWDTVEPNHVIADTLFAVRKSDNKIVGIINLRYALNEHLLKTGGHIGYCVRPDERNKHYATNMLREALTLYREKGITPVLVTCNESNKASANVITNNGGVYESSEWDEDEGEPVRRYWIKL